MLLGQELKFKNKLCNLKLGTFFSAFTGLGTFGLQPVLEPHAKLQLSNFSNFPEQLRLLSLFLVVGVDGIVDGVVETTALFALYRHAGDEITHVDHVAKLA